MDSIYIYNLYCELLRALHRGLQGPSGTNQTWVLDVRRPNHLRSPVEVELEPETKPTFGYQNHHLSRLPIVLDVGLYNKNLPKSWFW